MTHLTNSPPPSLYSPSTFNYTSCLESVEKNYTDQLYRDFPTPPILFFISIIQGILFNKYRATNTRTEFFHVMKLHTCSLLFSLSTTSLVVAYYQRSARAARDEGIAFCNDTKDSFQWLEKRVQDLTFQSCCIKSPCIKS